ncbi:MAG TPA: Hsp20/alpha crystallin family protein [Acidothermaceae bacterium]|jgi:HSP20 family protein
MTITRHDRRPAGRWDPFAGFNDLYEEMSRLLTTAFPDASRISVNAWSPPVDVEETDDAYVVEADLPGVKAEDVSVDVHGNELRISAEIEQREHEGVLRRQTRRSGRFDYRVGLPGEVDSEGCDADLDNGVLTLRLPKTKASQRRRIPVHGPSQSPQSGEQIEAGESSNS